MRPVLMPTKLSHLLTRRDHDLLEALDWSPFTARQLLKLSAAWDQKFGSLRSVRERAQVLTALKLIRTFRYAALYPGQPENYYVHSRSGFQLLYGADASLSGTGQFEEIAISRHAHTRALAEFLVHTRVAAHASGINMTGFHRENTLRLEHDGQSLYPDATFLLVASDANAYRFFVEIDCGSERLRSDVAARSWQRKARIYCGVQDKFANDRFRVLVIAAQGSKERLSNILATCAEKQRVEERTLFCGTTLHGYLASFPSVRTPVFIDHRGRSQALVPAATDRSGSVDSRANLHKAKIA
ncbi:MAG: replication-relaxation family protein [Pirellulales bacterium]